MIKGTVDNICKRCGRKFKVSFYEDEIRKAAEKGYCLNCILGCDVYSYLEKRRREANDQ